MSNRAPYRNAVVNARGFSLTQLMVAMGVLVIVMGFTFMAPLMVNRSQKLFDRVKEFSDLKIKCGFSLRIPTNAAAILSTSRIKR